MYELISRMVRLPDPNFVLKKDRNRMELAGHSLHPGYEGPPMVTIELLRIRRHHSGSTWSWEFWAIEFW